MRFMIGLLVVGVSGAAMSAGCSSVKSAASAIPGSSMVGLGNDTSAGPKVGEKVHFKVSPDEAMEVLAEIAPAHGWELDAVGEQHDLQGLRGKYFRLLTRRFIGGVFEMNGVFFIEPGGTYIVVGKRESGFPQDLVAPFTAAIEAKTGGAKAQ
jgi:hypothetical protein